MAKTNNLQVRLSDTEMMDLERQAGAVNMAKSQLARLLLTTGQAGGQTPTPPTESLSEIKKMLDDQAEAMGNLLHFLAEQSRIPSFREYRSRLAAESIDKRENETDLAFLIRSANLYFAAYGVWPNPTETASFGPVGKVDLSQFPRHP